MIEAHSSGTCMRHACVHVEEHTETTLRISAAITQRVSSNTNKLGPPWLGLLAGVEGSAGHPCPELRGERRWEQTGVCTELG